MGRILGFMGMGLGGGKEQKVHHAGRVWRGGEIPERNAGQRGMTAMGGNRESMAQSTTQLGRLSGSKTTKIEHKTYNK